MKPIRVLHVITRFIVGGAQETALLYCALIDRKRFPSEILTGPQTGSEGDLFGEARTRGVRVHLEPMLVREVNPLKDPIAVVRLAAFFRRFRPDVVHTHSSKAGIVGRVAARLAGVPHVVHTVHGWGFHTEQTWKERFTYQTLERWCAPLADCLVVVAEANRTQALELGIGRPEQYRVIRSGIEIEQYAAGSEARAATRASLGLPPDAFVFGSVGRLSPPKAPLDLVAAFAQVAARHQETRLVLVGDGPLRNETERAVDAAGLTGRVVFTGLRLDVPELLHAFDAFVFASRWEGLPRVVPQALAARLPVVATATDGTPEAVREGESGYLVAPGDVAGLAERMLWLVRDPERARSLGAKGCVLVEEFSAARMVEKLGALYDELTRRGGAPGDGRIP